MSAQELGECNDNDNALNTNNNDNDDNDDNDKDHTDMVLNNDEDHLKFLDKCLLNLDFSQGYGVSCNPSPLDGNERPLQEAESLDTTFSCVDSDASDEEKPLAPLPGFSETDIANGYAFPVATQNPSPSPQPPRSSPLEIRRLQSEDKVTKKKTTTTKKKKQLRATHIGALSPHLIRPPIPMGKVFDELSARKMVINRAELAEEEKVGEGFFGMVRQAVYQGQQVAVKYLYLQDNPEFNFRREVRNLLHVSDHHGHRVVQLLGVVRDGCLALVFPYYPEGSLRRFISTRTPEDAPMPWRYRLMREIALALFSLHWVGLIHSDVTAENILISLVNGEPHPLLADLGLSRFRNHNHSHAHDHLYMAGHLSTRAPETMNGGLCTAKADIFSLSIVFWEVVTLNTRQRPPKEAASDHTLGIRRRLDAVPPKIRPLFVRMWDQNPDARPSAKDVVTELKLLIDPPKDAGTLSSRSSDQVIAQEETDVWHRFEQRAIRTKRKPTSAASSSSSSSASSSRLDDCKSTPERVLRKKEKSERSKLSMDKHLETLRLNSLEQERPKQLFEKSRRF